MSIVHLLKKPEVDQELVEVLESALAYAKAGRIIGLAVVAQCEGEETRTLFHYDSIVNKLAVIGGLEALKHRMLSGDE